MPAFALKLDVPFNLGDIHSLTTLTPAPSTIVTFNYDGSPCSKFSDPTWLLAEGGPRPLPIDFSAIQCSTDYRLQSHNIRVAKRIMLHQMYSSTVRSIDTLRGQWFALRTTAIYFTRARIRLDDLWRFDSAVREWADAAPYVTLNFVAGIASGLHTNQRKTGFFCLTPAQIKYLYLASKKSSTVHQTPYIPARLHDALLEDCHKAVDEFHARASDFKAFYVEYIRTFNEPRHWKRRRYGTVLSGHNSIKEEIIRMGRGTGSPASLLRYLNDVRQAALVLVANYTLARKSETLSLRQGCYREIVDPHLGQVSMVEGGTRKAQSNPNALWVSTPKIRPALEVLALIAGLVAGGSGVRLKKFFVLFSKLPTHYSGHSHLNHEHASFALASLDSAHMPAFMSHDRFRITRDDYEEAITVTPTLDDEKFEIGAHWPFALHQFRRTMIVRCAASGIVSPQTLRFQAKHNCETMTWHYMSNYWKLKRSSDVPENDLQNTDALVAAEMLAEHVEQYNKSIDFVRRNARFMTPYGETLKARMVDNVPLISVEKAKRGEDTGIIKQTTLGLCLFRGFCHFRTAKSVKGCLTKNDGRMCTSALVDTENDVFIQEYICDIKDELEVLGANPRSKLKRTILEADLAYAGEALDLICAAKKKDNQ